LKKKVVLWEGRGINSRGLQMENGGLFKSLAIQRKRKKKPQRSLHMPIPVVGERKDGSRKGKGGGSEVLASSCGERGEASGRKGVRGRGRPGRKKKPPGRGIGRGCGGTPEKGGEKKKVHSPQRFRKEHS